MTQVRASGRTHTINEHDLGSVSVVDARHAGLLARAPWVASIVIARLDKSGSAAG